MATMLERIKEQKANGTLYGNSGNYVTLKAGNYVALFRGFKAGTTRGGYDVIDFNFSIANGEQKGDMFSITRFVVDSEKSNGKITNTELITNDIGKILDGKAIEISDISILDSPTTFWEAVQANDGNIYYDVVPTKFFNISVKENPNNSERPYINLGRPCEAPKEEAVPELKTKKVDPFGGGEPLNIDDDSLPF